MNTNFNRESIFNSWVTGVMVITTANDREWYGITTSNANIIRQDPPRLLVSLPQGTPMHDALDSNRVFVINILGAAHQSVAEQFADGISGKVGEPMAGVTIIRASTNAPIITNALAWMECRVRDVLPLDKDTLFVGDVIQSASPGVGAPLLYPFTIPWERWTEMDRQWRDHWGNWAQFWVQFWSTK